MSAVAETKSERRSRLIKLAVVGVIAVAVAVLVWNVLHSVGVTKRKPAPPPTMIALLPPPPPPPPTPPKEKPPEPEKMQEVPRPDDQPKTPAPPQQLTINGPAQAGGDSFGIQAGSGGGSKVLGAGEPGAGGEGVGMGAEFYNRYLSSALQEAMQGDARINRLVFRAEVAVWIDGAGRVARAAILKTSGDAKVDRSLVAALQQVAALDEPPPSSVKFPQRVTIRGRRGV